jgi:protein ImuB
MKRVLAVWLLNWPQRLLSGRLEQSVVPVPSPPTTILPAPSPPGGGGRRKLLKLAQWCHRYTPTAGLEASEPCETLLLDATNLAPLYGSEEIFVSQVAQGLRRLGLDVRIALAATIGAAWALAHYGELNDNQPAIVPSDQTRAALAPLPIAALRLPDDLLETLHALGVEHIGDLMALPREQLRSRFGPLLLVRVDQALGTVGEVFVAVDPPEEFVVEQMFEFPLAQRESLEHVVETLLGRLAWMLSARCAGALQVVCRFECEAAPAAEFEVGLFQPTANPRHLLEIVELEMERLRLRAPAIAVSIRAVRHAPLAERQGVLFDEERSLEGSLPLAALVNRLTGRLGRGAVVRCRLQREAQPELAYKEEPLVSDSSPSKVAEGLRRRGARGGIGGASTLGPLDRPLHLLRRPAALETVSVIPDGPPIHFRRAGQLHVIERHWGPERIETGWWRGRSAWRDYYRVETAEGRRFWLYRRHRDGRWFLHGVFE